MDSSDILEGIMSKPVVTVEYFEPVKKAMHAMIDKDIGNVVVVEKGNPVGILTERDIIRKLAGGKEVVNLKVGDIMSKPLITASPKTKNFEALEMLQKNKIRRLPVVLDGKLVGIGTDKDLTYWVIKVGYAPNPPPY